jgi:hypothetical protein
VTTELGLDGKELRKWLRERFPRQAQECGTDWHLSHAEVMAARRKFDATL